MANLTAKFKLIDEMSSKLDNIAQSGRDALTQWEQAGSAIDTAFDGAVSSATQTARSIDDTSDSIEGITSAAEKFDKANKELEEGLEEVAKDAEKAGREVEDFGEESEEAGRKSEEFGNKTESALRDIEELFVGAGIVQGIEAIGQAFIDCVEDAIEFESAITGVYKTVDGTPEQLAAISDEVKELSLVIPSTTTEIAAVAEAAGQLGIATDDVMTFTEVMINLGEATNLTSDEAASSLAKFANITGLSADEYEALGSTVVALGNNMATTEADIVAMSTRMASAGTLAGLTESEILALAASISSVGIEADAGGSSMSTLLSKMQLAIETGSEELEQYASVAGYTADEFTQKWGTDAVGALYDFIAGLNDTQRNGASATEILDEMGITEIRLSNAVKALSNSHEGMSNALDIANKAWEENTALATEADTRYSTLESKLKMTTNAQTNLSTAIGEVFTPTVSDAADVYTGFLNGLSDFVTEHPTIVKAITAVTVGAAAFTTAIVAYTAAAKIATIASTALSGALAAHPFLLAGAAIAGVTATLVTFAVTTRDAEDESTKLTAASEKQAEELENLKAEYDRVCDSYGETSYQAQELSWKIEDLSDEFDENKRTVQEYREEFDKTMNSYNEMVERHEKATEELEKESASVLSLVYRLDELTQQTDVTAAEQKEILAIIEALNKAVPNLNLSYDELTNRMSSSIDVILALAEAEAATRLYDEHQNQLIERIQNRYELEKQKTDALEEQGRAYSELLTAQQNYANAEEEAYKKWPGATPNGPEATKRTNYINEQKAALDAAQDAYDKFTQDVTDATNAITENEDKIAELTGELSELATTTEENTDAITSYEGAVDYALSTVEDDIEELCAAYDEAYKAAYESIDGQIGLFQEMKTETETSIADMQKAMESQYAYLTNYTENLQKAKELGLDASLISDLSDGSEESAAYLDTIIGKIEALGGTTEDAKNFISDFNSQFQKVEDAKQTWSDTVAEMETNFDTEMSEIEKRLETSIDNLTMEDEAAAAAKATMDSYIAAITTGGYGAEAAAKAAATKVRNALGLSTPTEDGTGTEVTGYASGTASATAGVHLVGENGPELVEFEGGETVYPADETARILARSSESNFYASVPAETAGKEESSGDSSKTIRLEINGSGAIEVDKSMSEETVVSILYNHLKPVLTNIVKQEIYEEGDLAYDF